MTARLLLAYAWRDLRNAALGWRWLLRELRRDAPR